MNSEPPRAFVSALDEFQFNIAKYAITATTFSSVTKEITDSLKQTANKIG